jgi:hypothetical protein
MSLQQKMIVPLLDDSLTPEDFSKDSLFVGFYNYNINQPQLTNHIFLLYEYKLGKESVERDEKLLKSPNLYKSEFVKINKKSYVLYTFCILNPSVHKIMDNSMSVKNEDLIKIYEFWKFKEKDVNSYMINGKIDQLFKDEGVPEIDWTPDWSDIFKKKTGTSN